MTLTPTDEALTLAELAQLRAWARETRCGTQDNKKAGGGSECPARRPYRLRRTTAQPGHTRTV